MEVRSGGSQIPVFGSLPPGTLCVPREAAYVVIRNSTGEVAAIRAEVKEASWYWLPGGGIEAGETAEQAVARECREELGRTIRLVEPIGSAVQYFFAGDEGRWRKMTATFYRGEWDAAAAAAGEYELYWVDAAVQGEQFFHACHAWAARQASFAQPR